jgi:hypothetical protein
LVGYRVADDLTRHPGITFHRVPKVAGSYFLSQPLMNRLGRRCARDCGGGALWPVLRSVFARYVGVDIVRYVGSPADGEFVTANLDDRTLPLADECADVVASVETIEHLENPRSCDNSPVSPNRGAS